MVSLLLVSMPCASAASRCTVAQIEATPFACVANDPAVQNAKDRVAAAEQKVNDEVAAAQQTVSDTVAAAVTAADGAVGTATSTVAGAPSQVVGTVDGVAPLAESAAQKATAAADKVNCGRLAGHHFGGNSNATIDLALDMVGLSAADHNVDAFYNDMNNLDQVCANNIG